MYQAKSTENQRKVQFQLKLSLDQLSPSLFFLVGGKDENNGKSTDLSRIICLLECITDVHRVYPRIHVFQVTIAIFLAPHLHISQMCNNTKLRYT